MKYFKLLATAVCFILLTACSGGGSYNAEECKQLSEMASKKEAMTEKDYGQMIDQFEAMSGALTDAYKKYGKEAALDSLSSTPEGKEMLAYFAEFAMYLTAHTDDLTTSQKLHYAKIGTKLDQINK